MIVLTEIALPIVMMVPDHFLEEHLWRHVARRHAARIFLWTLEAPVAMHLLAGVFPLQKSFEAGAPAKPGRRTVKQ